MAVLITSNRQSTTNNARKTCSPAHLCQDKDVKSVTAVLLGVKGTQSSNMMPTKGLMWRVSFLFFVGVLFCLMLDFFQITYRISEFERNLIGSVFMSSPWWVPAICGTAAVSVGLLYPCVDHKLGEETIPHRWSDVMKCIALFVGINQASAKIELQSDWQPSMSLVLLSVSLWWLCDRTHSGFGLSILTAVIATLVAHFLVYYRIGRCSEKDLAFVRSWLPCVFFSGGITVGNIGRLLALDNQEEALTDKKHRE